MVPAGGCAEARSGRRYLVAHLLDGVGTGVSTVTTHHEEHIDAPHVNAFDDLPKVSSPAASAKYCASLQLDVIYSLVVENDGLAGGVVETLEAVPACEAPLSR